MRSLYNIFLVAYEDPPAPPAPPQDPPPAPPAPAPKTFTQEQVNTILAREKKAVADRLSKLGELSSLTEQQANELAELRGSLQTVEEQRAEELNVLKKKYETETTTLKTSAESWQKRFSDSTIKRELQSAFAPVAHDPDQFIELFASKAELVEVKVDGKLTGEFEVRVPHTLEVEGKKVTKKLTPSELQKALYDTPKYANLFKGKGSGGTGGGSTGSSQGLSNEEYIKQRLAGKVEIS